MIGYNVAVLGATGAVGTELLKILAERNFPIDKLVLLAAPEEKGTVINYQGVDYIVDAPDEHSSDGIDIALFAGGSISKVYAPIAAAAGAIVIDNSLEPAHCYNFGTAIWYNFKRCLLCLNVF